MLMTVPEKYTKEKRQAVGLNNRNGHRAARVNDSVVVVGGVDEKGQFASQLLRINELTGSLDPLITDTGLTLEGFTFFPHQENLYLWGGHSQTAFTNQLMLFEGSRLVPQTMRGSVPSPRAYHSSVTFGGKYLLVFGGNDSVTFFNDWHLLNIWNGNWTQLTPSLELPPCSKSRMVWLSGRGFLLLNDYYDYSLNRYLPNKLFEFSVTNFLDGLLRVTPLQVGQSVFRDFWFEDMVVDGDFLLLLGGHPYQPQRHESWTNILKRRNSFLTLKIHPQLLTVEAQSLPLPELYGFESFVYKSKLYLVGGYCPSQPLGPGLYIYSFITRPLYYQRHVCEMCKLYYDEEFYQNTSEIFHDQLVREDYDYNYKMRMENSTLKMLSTFIPHPHYAYTTLLSSLVALNTCQLSTSFHKAKSIKENTFMKVEVDVDPRILLSFYKHFLMENQQFQSDNVSFLLDRISVQLKMACLRLSQTSLLTLKLSDQTIVICFSSDSLECTNNPYQRFNFHQYSPEQVHDNIEHQVQQGIIHQNMNHLLKNPSIYENPLHDLTIILFPPEQLEAELTLIEHGMQEETGETCNLKDEHKKTIPLIQLSFLPSHPLRLLIDHTPVKFHPIQDILQADTHSHILSELSLPQPQPPLHKIRLFEYPEEYWFKKILVYCRSKLVTHLNEQGMQICGVIELEQQTPLDLTETNLSSLVHKRLLSQTIHYALKRHY